MCVRRYACVCMLCVCTTSHLSIARFPFHIEGPADTQFPFFPPSTPVLTTHAPTHTPQPTSPLHNARAHPNTNTPTQQLKQLAREAFTLAVTDLLGLLNAALAQVGSMEEGNGVGVLSLLSIPAPTLSNNVSPHTARACYICSSALTDTHVTFIGSL